MGQRGAKKDMEREFSVKELQDDVPAEAYVNVPCYKFLDSFDPVLCMKLDGCVGFSHHDFDCPIFDYEDKFAGVW